MDCDLNRSMKIPRSEYYNCLFCQKESKTGNSKANKYCSNECQGAHRKETTLKEWLAGNYANATGKFPLVAKEWIRKEQNDSCLHCSITNWNGKPIVFQFDHIDGNPDNNHRSNIRMLCPNCHSQTETYGAKNKSASASKRNIYRRKNYRDNITIS